MHPTGETVHGFGAALGICETFLALVSHWSVLANTCDHLRFGTTNYQLRLVGLSCWVQHCSGIGRVSQVLHAASNPACETKLWAAWLTGLARVNFIDLMSIATNYRDLCLAAPCNSSCGLSVDIRHSKCGISVSLPCNGPSWAGHYKL